MPDPIAPLSSSLSLLPAQAVHTHFATRPALYSVVFNALRRRILEHYPSLQLNLREVKLASPHPEGHYTYRPLMEVAIAHALNPQLLDLHSQRELPYYLTEQIPKVLKPEAPALIDMQVIATLIDELPGSLYLHFQHDLADYWSAVDTHGISRWQWLGEYLNGQMTAAAARQSSLNETQRDMLAVVAAWPTLLERLPHSSPATYVYFIENTFNRADTQALLLTPDLLVVRDKHVLLYSLAGEIETFDSIDTFGQAWATRMQARFAFDSMTWRRNEPDGNVFEQQAGLILNQQLQDLATLQFQGQDEASLGRRLETLTDPARLFTKTPSPAASLVHHVSRQLPAWLSQADSADRFAYHRHLQDMAQVLQQNQNRSFNQGIEDIHGFSRAALRKQMQTDHGDYDPDEVVLDFTLAAGYPGGSGIASHVRMSLTELAVKNLAGKPSGTLKILGKDSHALPTWLTESYLLGATGLIQRVDIGTAYPQKIKDTLLSDTADARRREALFTRELRVKLPLQALEYKIRRQHGVTVTGYRYVKALMGHTPSDRLVDGEEIVLRPLALCRKAGATPDEVNNAFVIEPRDTAVGPHLLYQPLYADALHEYPTRQALLDALATPGALQDSVLTWLSDKARPIYDHGGIKEPHLIRFLPGDEFSVPEKPAPATLAVDEGAGEWLQSQVNGQLLNHLFGSTARALVDLADRESVSNSESRWAIMMEGAWLLFNTLLLPLVRGPAMLAGWLMVLVGSLEQDLAGLDSTDPTTRELALIDLLLNTAMVLLHAAAPADRSRQPLPEPTAQDHALHLETWRRPAGRPLAPGAASVRQGSVAFPGEPPATGHTTLDFSRSLASPSAGTKLLKALVEVHVAWPEPLPSPQPSGAFKGLYRIAQTWHASVGGLLFQVNVVPGFGEVYLLHPQHPQRPGFRLISDGQGHWRLDRHARLEGGMPRQRETQWQARRNERLRVLNAELSALRTQMFSLMDSSIPFESALNAARATLVEQAKSLRKDWLLLGTSAKLPELQASVAKRHQARRLTTAQARVQWEIALDNFQQNGLAVAALMSEIEAKANELLAVDRTNPQYARERERAIKTHYSHWGAVFELRRQRLADTLESENGESADELHERINKELLENVTGAYDDYIETLKRQAEALKDMIEPAERIEALLYSMDPSIRRQLLQDRPTDQSICAVAIKQHSLLVFIDLVYNRTHGSREMAELPFIQELRNPLIPSSVLAHTEMRTTTGYTVQEQMAVLKDALEHYEHLQNAVNSLTDMGSGFIRDAYRAPFLAQLAEARASLDVQLANLMLVEEGFAPQPTPDRPTREKPSNRRVIKTRDQKNLVGDLRPSQPDMPGNFVDIKDPVTGKTVATYLEHASEGLWNVVKQTTAAKPAPAPAPAVRSLKTIKAHLQTVRDERAGIDARIRFQQRMLQEPSRREGLMPQDWDVMLTQHAEKFAALATELKRDHAADSSAIELMNHALDAAKAATQQAREVCGEAYKQQRPKAAKVAYLWRHGFVDINLVRSRFKLHAGDYLTEYAIRDKNKIKEGKKGDDNVLWYAHFHYPNEHTPSSTPAFGHLKTKAERLFTRRQLIEQARADNRQLVEVAKSEINPPLDQELFLGLEVLEPA